MLKSVLKALGLDPNDRLVARYREKAVAIGELAEEVAKLSNQELAESATYFRERLEQGETLDDILPEVFARVREVSQRTLGLRHFDEQLIGGMALHYGKIAEMKTGEGKTLVATLAVVLNAIEGKGVHVVTVNDYLAKRDAEWMGPVYRGMGLSVGTIYPYMDPQERYEAYRQDITYGTNSEFGFDYLKDNMALSLEQQVQRGHEYCIVDEVDSILIDEARTPLIISGPSEESTEPYKKADTISRELRKALDFEVDEKERNVSLTEQGVARCEELLKLPDLFTDYAHSALAHKITQSLRAHYLYQKDTHYVVKDGEIIIVDEFTGRLMVGRRYSEGLHQAIEAKERVKVGKENQTLATITLQNYFRLYRKLAGMTGTAVTEEEEFQEIYGLGVVVIPTHRPMTRKDNADLIFRTTNEKYYAAVEEAGESHKRGQPVLIGTASIDHSERVSRLLKAHKIPHSVLNAKVHEKEAAIVAQAGRFGAVTVATNMAGRGTDIILGGNPEFMTKEECARKGEDFDVSTPEHQALLNSFREQCKAEQEKVLEQGGLRIIGTERHESRRIDNQLRGRAGRQGDPGESRFYIALEDDLLRLFGGEMVQNFMTKLGMEEGDSIEHPLLNRAIENAQRKVEEINFEIRKQLLAYDNVMNQQREATYREREDLLSDDNMVDRVWGIIEDTLIAEIDPLKEQKEGVLDVTSTAVKLKGIIWPGAEQPLLELKDRYGVEEAQEKIIALVRERFDAKVGVLGEETANALFRFIVLQVLDDFWKEQLLAMDELRRGIGLRAIGQKDPLLEYQFESFTLFQNMLTKVREEITSLALKVEVVTERQQQQNIRLERPDLFSTMQDGDSPAEKNRPVQKGHKIGRNDLCPCNSGKKYKYCCGRDIPLKTEE